GAVAVHLLEVREQHLHVVERVRPLRVARHLRHLPGRELAVDVFGERLAALRQTLDFRRDVDRRIVLRETQLLDLGLELRDRLLEFEEGGLHRAAILTDCDCTLSRYAATTLFLPALLPSYSALSARASSALTGSFLAYVATPTVTVTRGTPGNALASVLARTRSAQACAPTVPVPGRMIRNSSPPKRPWTSTARSSCGTRRAKSFSTLSPAAWPKPSLIALKWSMSIRQTANGALWRSARDCSRPSASIR